jgi:hypothetical protein
VRSHPEGGERKMDSMPQESMNWNGDRGKAKRNDSQRPSFLPRRHLGNPGPFACAEVDTATKSRSKNNYNRKYNSVDNPSRGEFESSTVLWQIYALKRSSFSAFLRRLKFHYPGNTIERFRVARTGIS